MEGVHMSLDEVSRAPGKRRGAMDGRLCRTAAAQREGGWSHSGSSARNSQPGRTRVKRHLHASHPWISAQMNTVVAEGRPAHMRRGTRPIIGK